MAEAGREAGTLMGGVVVMLLAAGMLEGFARQLINVDCARYAIAGGHRPALARLLLPAAGSARPWLSRLETSGRPRRNAAPHPAARRRHGAASTAPSGCGS